MYRPLFHFSPPFGWMNDPNGLVFYEGKWHLFYQHTPDEIIWGPMHWGHAVSTNLVDWEPLEIALYPDELGTIFSGSIIVRPESPPLVACFTHAGDDGQVQSLAFSNDGQTWEKFAGNPVLRGAVTDFRDPKVFRFVNGWRMIVCAGPVAQLYGSSDLIHWNLLSTFPPPETGGVWECPDLFELDGEWILLGSFAHWEAPPTGPSSTRYWIGSFDGVNFFPRSGPELMSFGPDDYAAVTWSNTPNEEKWLIGWMSHWAYARLTPTGEEGWRGAMTLPRKLSLQNGQLIQRPPAALLERSRAAVPFVGGTVELNSEACEVFTEVEFFENSAASMRLEIIGNANEKVVVFYENGNLSVDRTLSGKVDFHANFGHVFHSFVPLENNRLKLEIFIDRSSVEIFAQGGKYYGAFLVFPTSPFQEIVFTGVNAHLTSGATFPLELIPKI